MKPAIVCVDDEKVILDSLKTQLKSAFGASYSYEMAENAFDALDLIEELHEDGQCMVVIVSDWLMPGMDGGELAACLQSSPRLKGVPIVFLTALVTKKEVAAGDGLVGRFPILAKPIILPELAACLKKHLGG